MPVDPQVGRVRGWRISRREQDEARLLLLELAELIDPRPQLAVEFVPVLTPRHEYYGLVLMKVGLEHARAERLYTFSLSSESLVAFVRSRWAVAQLPPNELKQQIIRRCTVGPLQLDSRHRCRPLPAEFDLLIPEIRVRGLPDKQLFLAAVEDYCLACSCEDPAALILRFKTLGDFEYIHTFLAESFEPGPAKAHQLI